MAIKRELVFPLLVGMLLIGCCTSAATAGIIIIPAQPTTHDSVRVRVGSRFSDTCWHDTTAVCQQVPPDTLTTTVHVIYCGGRPFCVCGAFPYSYTRVCNFGILPAGSYTAIFIERHDPTNDPIGTSTQSVQFTVVAPTPVLRKTWGRLKRLYR